MEGVGERDSVMPPWGWRWTTLSHWPRPLQAGVGGNWQGWSEAPDWEREWPESSRKAVRKALLKQYQQAGLDAPASLSLLEETRCRAVTVGHQLVLGGGPAFLHHKILSALRVARLLSQREKRPVVAVFWMASEDHDWKEVATVVGSERDHTWLPDEPDVPHPVGARSLNGLAEVLPSWAEDGAPAEEVASLMRELEAARAAGQAYSGLFRRWLHRWYGQEGLLVLDAEDPELKVLGSELWAAEFSGQGVHAALAGTPQADGPALVRENNVFWLDNVQGRVGVVSKGMPGAWKAGAWEVTAPEQGWLSWAESHAARCSPGVLLRPLYQELLLQSVAVVLGPGEWNYWHQLPTAFERHGLPFPALRLRDHGVVLSSDTVAVGWGLDDGWMHDEEWDRWVLDRWLREHERAWNEMSSELARWTAGVEAWSSEVVPSASGAMGAFDASVQKAWSQFLKKVRRALKGQRAEEWAQARQACGWLMRRGAPQDRWANWHVLAGSSEEAKRWGEAWLDEGAGLEARVWCFGPLDQKTSSSN